MRKLLFLSFGLLLAVPAFSKSQTPEWTWIHGELPDPQHQEMYLEQVTQMHASYQERGRMTGKLIPESELESWPRDHVVMIGPITAFQHPERCGLPLEATDGGIQIGGQHLKTPAMGVYLRGEGSTRYAYTGLSMDGYQSIFTVPTGMMDCTITHRRGKTLFEGNHEPNGLTLKRLPFLPTYPTASDLAEFDLSEAALGVEPVVTEPESGALEAGFSTWLDGFVTGQRVLFFGETHWSSGVNRLFNSITLHLLRTGRLRAVFLELNYSFSGFYDHYISEPDEARAREFFESELHPLVASGSTRELLEILRAWNLAHPDDQARIGCLDMEWNPQNVIQRIIHPYFRRLDTSFTFSPKDPGSRQRLEQLLKKAKQQELVGEYPFLNAQYMATVVANLFDTLDLNTFDVDRQRGIIRNMTEFHGALLEEDLTLFKGGGWHAVKYKPSDEPYYRDAAYLHEVYPRTKGKVVSLYARGLGIRFGEIAELNLNQRFLSATAYNYYLRDFQSAWAAGHAKKDTHYLLDGEFPGTLDHLMMKTGHALNRDMLRLTSIDWDRLAAIHGESLLQDPVRNYDATIYVLRSGIEVMRPLKLGTR